MPKKAAETSTRDRPRRLWWQVILRWGLVAALLLGLVYVTIPFWAPKGYLRSRLARQMARQLGVGVEIASLQFSWSRGVEIGKLTFSSPEGFSRQPMISVDRIQADFDPLSFLLRNRLEWMEVDRLKIAAQVDASGRLNLAAMQHLTSGFQTQRISIHQASVSLLLAGYDRPLQLAVSNLEYQTGGRPGLGQLTLSGQLRQEDDVSPISLRVATGTPQPIVATASLSFANLDLSQLPLLEWLPLPLTRLNGRCRGHLDLQMDSQGVVSRFGGDLTIADLDAQPAGGPDLPVIAEAGIQLSGLLDPITNHVELERFRARLPGLDLAGRVEMSADLLAGRWGGLRSLELAGQVRPGELAAVLTGSAETLGGLTLHGPVELELSAAQDGPLLNVDFSADAGQVAAYRFGRQVKPAGRAVRLALDARLDRRAWQVEARQASLVLGENHFTGGGRIDDLRRLIERRRDSNLAGPDILLRDLCHLTWSGAWEIRELDSLFDLFATPAGHRCDLQGAINGQWIIRTEDLSRCHIRLAVPAETAVTVGRLFEKPAGRPAALEIGWAIDPDCGEVESFNADLAVGPGRLSLDDGRGAFPAGAESQLKTAPMRLTGRFKVEKIEAILASLPFLKPFQTCFAGTSDGRFAGEFDGGVWTSGQCDADLTGLAVHLGQAFVKPPGQDAGLSLRLARQQAQPERAGLRRISFQGHVPAGTYQGTATIEAKSDQAPGGSGRAQMRLDLEDLRQLMSASPPLADLLAQEDLSGPLRLDAALGWSGEALEVGVGLDAKDAQWVSRRPAGRRKAAGVKCKVHLQTRLTREAGNGLRVEIHSGEFNLAQSTARCSGQMYLQGPSINPLSWAVPILENVDAQLQADLLLEPGLKELLPELARLSEKCDLAGTATVLASVSGTERCLGVRAELDADAISGRYQHKPKPTTQLVAIQSAATTQPATLDRVLLALSPAIKPAKLQANLRTESVFRPYLGHLAVNTFHGRIGGLEFRGDASVELPADANADAPFARLKSGHIELCAPDARKLDRLLPVLEEYELAGEGAVTVTWRSQGDLPVLDATTEFDRLRGTYRGREVLANGSLGVEGLHLRPRPRSRATRLPTTVDRLQTESLELSAGKNHAFLIADLTNLPNRPSGELTVLAPYLDDKDLRDWLSPQPDQAVELGQDEPDRSPTVREKSAELLEKARPHLVPADVALSVDIDRLKTFDVSVEETYEVQGLALRAAVRQGRVEADYVGAMNGGRIEASYRTDLNAQPPVMRWSSRLRGVMATDDFQPQLAKFFPGNTFSGTFQREEQSEAPLAEMIAFMRDGRYPLHPVGQAKTVTTDGVLVGRALPGFVRRIFPGLDLTRYRYNKMTGFAEMQPGGTAINDMVFSGRAYDIYIEGTTDAENFGKYQIGLILLGTPQPAEWNHKYRQGRIPLLKFQGRIEGGKIHDEKSSFLWPNQALFVIFLKNNIFYRVWLASR